MSQINFSFKDFVYQRREMKDKTPLRRSGKKKGKNG